MSVKRMNLRRSLDVVPRPTDEDDVVPLQSSKLVLERNLSDLLQEKTALINQQVVRCVFTWNRSRIPDPTEMIRVFHTSSIRVVANVKPFFRVVAG